MYQAIQNTSSIKRLADGATIPNDPRLSDYASYLEWVAAGGVLQPFAQVSFAELKAQETARFAADREKLINRITSIGFQASVAGDTAQVAAVIALRQALVAIMQTPSIVAATDIAAFKLAVRNQYALLISQAPPSLQIEFAKVDK